jgi:hypothetical protein
MNRNLPQVAYTEGHRFGRATSPDEPLEMAEEQRIRLGWSLHPTKDKPRFFVIFVCFVNHQSNRFE